jgi:hypothetical protein
MGLTAKFVPANDLPAVDMLETRKAPEVVGAFLISSFNYIGLTITKNRFGESSILLMGFELWVFCGVWGLDMRFC